MPRPSVIHLPALLVYVSHDSCVTILHYLYEFHNHWVDELRNGNRSLGSFETRTKLVPSATILHATGSSSDPCVPRFILVRFDLALIKALLIW